MTTVDQPAPDRFGPTRSTRPRGVLRCAALAAALAICAMGCGSRPPSLVIHATACGGATCPLVADGRLAAGAWVQAFHLAVDGEHAYLTYLVSSGQLQGPRLATIDLTGGHGRVEPVGDASSDVVVVGHEGTPMLLRSRAGGGAVSSERRDTRWVDTHTVREARLVGLDGYARDDQQRVHVLVRSTDPDEIAVTTIGRGLVPDMVERLGAADWLRHGAIAAGPDGSVAAVWWRQSPAHDIELASWRRGADTPVGGGATTVLAAAGRGAENVGLAILPSGAPLVAIERPDGLHLIDGERDTLAWRFAPEAGSCQRRATRFRARKRTIARGEGPRDPCREEGRDSHPRWAIAQDGAAIWIIYAERIAERSGTFSRYYTECCGVRWRYRVEDDRSRTTLRLLRVDPGAGTANEVWSLPLGGGLPGEVALVAAGQQLHLVIAIQRPGSGDLDQDIRYLIVDPARLAP